MHLRTSTYVAMASIVLSSVAKHQLSTLKIEREASVNYCTQVLAMRRGGKKKLLQRAFRGSYPVSKRASSVNTKTS